MQTQRQAEKTTLLKFCTMTNLPILIEKKSIEFQMYSHTPAEICFKAHSIFD
jgi:hypothetical protein